MKTYLTNVNIFLEDRIITNGTIAFDGENIAAVGNNIEFADDAKVIDCKGLAAIPGYIEAHCHGGGGFDCNDGTLKSMLGMRNFYAAHGITTIYPSLAANAMDTIIEGIESIGEAMKMNHTGAPEIAGCHLEGPFLNKVYKGSQAEDRIIPITDQYLQMYDKYKHIIKRTTIAPEVENNVDYFPAIAAMGIQISVGHSCATITDVEHAMEKGATSVTHLYNAMSQTKKEGPFRIGGVVEAGLTFNNLYAEIIADGYHLPNELIRIAYRCKGVDKLSVCSDANAAAGCKSGTTIHTCGMTYYIEQGVAMNEARTSLASSITPIDKMVQHLIFDVGLPPIEVVRMASGTTAKMMNIYAQKGSIAVGKRADINIIDDKFNVIKTFCGGKLSFSK